MARKILAEGTTFKSGRWILRISRTRGNQLCVDLEYPDRLRSDRSIYYPFNGRVAYDWPERIPQSVKDHVKRIYSRMVSEGLKQ
jgi:hypothetical protein